MHFEVSFRALPSNCGSVLFNCMLGTVVEVLACIKGKRKHSIADSSSPESQETCLMKTLVADPRKIAICGKQRNDAATLSQRQETRKPALAIFNTWISWFSFWLQMVPKQQLPPEPMQMRLERLRCRPSFSEAESDMQEW